ncbi:hypothetical protein [Caballeronia sp. NK8]|uniref:hypothetical protein n=1 Tax=Caballeronia sp. NK8 TaxID=140098 RepID=UPI001BD10D97|nr:hypothetical protein [Caballeronia sp. NK8]
MISPFPLSGSHGPFEIVDSHQPALDTIHEDIDETLFLLRIHPDRDSATRDRLLAGELGHLVKSLGIASHVLCAEKATCGSLRR